MEVRQQSLTSWLGGKGIIFGAANVLLVIENTAALWFRSSMPPKGPWIEGLESTVVAVVGGWSLAGGSEAVEAVPGTEVRSVSFLVTVTE